MNYKIELIKSFKKDVKKLSKKYKNIKQDLKTLKDIFYTSNPKTIGSHIGRNCYKIRLKNSSISKGKSGGYRVIYYYFQGDTIILLSIYSKSKILILVIKRYKSV